MAPAGMRAPVGESWLVADTPDELTLSRHRDLRGRERRPVTRWVLLSVLAALCVLGLLNVFGQRPRTDERESDVGRFEVYSPDRVRGGLFYMSRFTIEARREIENATVVLDPGWLEGVTLNTLEPAPVGEAIRVGRLALELGRVRAGTKHVFFLHFQVNPTNIGRRAADVDLFDGDKHLFHVDRSVTVWP